MTGLLYARRPRSSPPLWVRARTPGELAERAAQAQECPPWRRREAGVFQVARMRRLALVAEYLATKAPREVQVAETAARGMTDGQIAAVVLAARERRGQP